MASEAVALGGVVSPPATREVFDAPAQDYVAAGVFERTELKPGDRVEGPALIVETQTTTVVTSHFDAHIDGRGYIVLTAKQGA